MTIFVLLCLVYIQGAKASQIETVVHHFNHLQLPYKLQFPFVICEKENNKFKLDAVQNFELRFYYSILDVIFELNKNDFKQMNIKRENLCIEIVPDDDGYASTTNTLESHGVIKVRHGLYLKTTNIFTLVSIFLHEIAHIILDSGFYVDLHSESEHLKNKYDRRLQNLKKYLNDMKLVNEASRKMNLFNYKQADEEFKKSFESKYFKNFYVAYDELAADYVGLQLYRQFGGDLKDFFVLQELKPELLEICTTINEFFEFNLQFTSDGIHPTACTRTILLTQYDRIKSNPELPLSHQKIVELQNELKLMRLNSQLIDK